MDGSRADLMRRAEAAMAEGRSLSAACERLSAALAAALAVAATAADDWPRPIPPRAGAGGPNSCSPAAAGDDGGA